MICYSDIIMLLIEYKKLLVLFFFIKPFFENEQRSFFLWSAISYYIASVYLAPLIAFSLNPLLSPLALALGRRSVYF